MMENKIRIQYVSDEGLEYLKGEFDSNLEKYKKGDQEYFLKKLTENNDLLESSYVIDDFTDQLVYDKSDEADYHNIRVVYDAMRLIPPYVMMDDRFWAGVNHTMMWKYIRKRRKNEAFGKDIKRQEEQIFNSYFTHTKNGKKRGTYVNCVSRLWWAGYLTYDEKREDPFELTKEICQTGFPSTMVLFSSYNILERKKTAISYLEKIQSMRAQGMKVARDDMVAGMRYLNLVAGSSVMDILTEQEITAMLDEFYTRHYNARG